MEDPKITDGRQNIIKEENAQTVILPMAHRRRRVNVLKLLFFLFLLGFFVFCVWLTGQRLFSEGQLAAEVFTEFLIEQGLGMPK